MSVMPSGETAKMELCDAVLGANLSANAQASAKDADQPIHVLECKAMSSYQSKPLQNRDNTP